MGGDNKIMGHSIFKADYPLMQTWLNRKGYSGGINEMFRDYFRFLLGGGEGNINDLAHVYFGRLGYTGDTNERINAYISNVTGISDPIRAQRVFFGSPDTSFSSVSMISNILNLNSYTGSLWYPGCPVSNIAWGTMFQDSTGATPVTALEQAVGFMADRRYIECASYGENVFSSSTATVSGEASIVSPGVYRIYSSAGALCYVNDTKLTVGKLYLVTFTIDSITTAGSGLRIGDSGVQIQCNRTGVHTRTYLATTPSAFIKREAAAMDVQISNVSFQLVTLPDSAYGSDVVTDGSNETELFTLPTALIDSGVTRSREASPSGSGFAAKSASSDPANVKKQYSTTLLFEANKTYEFSGRFYVPTGGIANFRMFDNGDGSWFGVNSTTKNEWVYFSVLRVKSAAWTLGIGDNTLSTIASGNTCFWLDDLRIRELKGTHLIQATSGDRPTVSARYNQWTYSEQFDNAAWSKTRSSISANAIADPNGATTADKLVEDATAGNSHLMTQAVTTLAAPYTMIVHAKAGERTWIRIGNASVANTNAWFNLAAGTVGTVQASATATITAMSNGWYRCAITFTATAASNVMSIGISTSDNTSNYNGDGASGLYVWGADLRITAHASQTIPYYQRIGAGTAGVQDYNTTGPMTDGSTGTFPVYLAHPSSDNLYTTATMDFTGTDEKMILAGVLKIANGGIILEDSISSSLNEGVNWLFAGDLAGAATDYISFRSKGTASKNSDVTAIAPGVYAVGGYGKISTDDSTTTVNGVSSTVSLDQGTGNYGNFTLYVSSRGGTTLFFNGNIFYIVSVDGRATNATTRAVITADMARSLMKLTY